MTVDNKMIKYDKQISPQSWRQLRIHFKNCKYWANFITCRAQRNAQGKEKQQPSLHGDSECPNVLLAPGERKTS